MRRVISRISRACAFAAALWCSLGIAAPANASTIFFTGADLYALGGSSVFFPSTQPSVSGTSLLFGPGGSGDKLLVMPLSGVGNDLALTLDLTRRPCGTSACGVATYDHDPTIVLSDGTSLVGTIVSDNDNGSALGVTMLDTGVVPSSRVLDPTLFTNAGYPSIGDSFTVTVAFSMSVGVTDVAVGFLGGTGGFQEGTRALNSSSALSLVFMRDADGHQSEQYQINSLAITYTYGAPEPATLVLIALGLAGLGFARRRALH